MSDTDDDRPRLANRPDGQHAASRGSPRVDERRPRQGLLDRMRRSLTTVGTGLTPSAVVWPALVVAVSLTIVTTYLVTHPYPAYGAGLYLKISEEILANGYALPETIPGYTAGGVPFAYSPLMFYVASVLLDLGVAPVTVSRLLPATLTVAYSLVAYYVAREFLPTRRQAGVAALLLAVTPDVLQWHLSAGGMVRGFGFLLCLVGLVVGVRVFRDRRRRWAGAGVVVFALTILTHPVYTVFFGLSWLLLYLAADRSLRGLIAGAVVACGGVVATAPWWLQVASVHGPDIFFAAAGTHNGLGGGVGRLLEVFVFVDVDLLLPFTLLSYVATGWFLHRRRFFLPAWFLAAGYVVGKDRFLFLMGSMMAAAFLLEGVVPALRSTFGRPQTRRAGSAVALSVVVILAVVSGFYAAGALDTAFDDSRTLPAFIDSEDRAAMEWAATHTGSDADFVVLGDAAEWFPLYTDRTILVGYWGVEWTTPAQFQHQIATYEAVSTCDSGGCVAAVLASADVHPDYLYVPTDTYTVRGKEYVRDDALVQSLEASRRYERVHRNDGVVIFRVRSVERSAALATPGHVRPESGVERRARYRHGGSRRIAWEQTTTTMESPSA